MRTGGDSAMNYTKLSSFKHSPLHELSINLIENGRRYLFMADPNEKRNQTQSTGQQGGQQRQSNQPSDQQSGAMQAGGQGQRGGRMARRGAFAPSMFAL